MTFPGTTIRAVVMVAVVVAVACGGAPRAAPRTQLSTTQIVERSKPAIVRIEAASQRVGTGFAVDASGLIVTNLHVVAGAREIKVQMLDGTSYDVIRVAAVDPDHDLALLQITPRGKLVTLPLGDSAKVTAGERVIAIGNPLGVLDYSVSDGLISSVRVLSEQLTVLQISAPISQGSSGGPLLNQYGEVIGVATLIFTGGQNLNFGMPSNYVQPMLVARPAMTLEEFAARTAPPEDGPVAPGSDAKIRRKVPVHELAVLDGCTTQQVGEVVDAIGQAIELGAPLYNQGNHEACFRIYEGAAIRFERDGACPGVRDAFGDGLLRASTMVSFTEKAWALRDTFDGLLDVAVRRARSQP